MTQRFVSIGEAMVEMAPRPGTDTFGMGFAGDTLNTAWYARRLLGAGWSVDYATAVGRDAISDRMVGFLADSGLGTDHVQRVAGRTVGLYLISVEAGERSFAYWRSTSAARAMCDDPDRIAAALEGAAVAYLSGITLAILPPEGRAHLLAALERARGAGTRVVFDPNLRPALWPDGDTMRAAVTEAAGRSDLALPSFDDEAAHFGDADPAATARRYAEAGVPLVVVKNGAGAVLTRDHGQEATHPAQKAGKVVDTTAAGDSFNAGFLAAWLEGADLATAVARGGAVAVRVIGAPGALVAI